MSKDEKKIENSTFLYGGRVIVNHNALCAQTCLAAILMVGYRRLQLRMNGRR